MLENIEPGTILQISDAHGNIMKYKVDKDGNLENILNESPDKSFIPQTESEPDGMC